MVALRARPTAVGDKVVVVACHDQEVINLPGVVRLHLENGRLER